MIIQLQVLNYLLDTNDSSFLLTNNIDKSFFSDYEQEFLFIQNHINEYGNIPDKITFVNNFPNFDVIEVNESPNYLLDTLYEDRNKRNLARIFNKIKNLINANKIDEAMKLYTTASTETLKATHMDTVDILRDTSRYNKYIERAEDFKKYYVTTGFRELDELIGGWDRQEELATIAARPGVGKCLSKGTDVWMADGSIKSVENIKVGDKIQGNNRINTVLALHNGVSNGYRIIPKFGNPFIVSENHVLTLAKVVDKKLILEDILIEDYLSFPTEKKLSYKLYKPSLNFSVACLPTPPNKMGMLIGTGEYNASTIPLNYITSSIEQRKQLFNSIRYWEEKTYNTVNTLRFKTKTLTQQIQQIASSIGVLTDGIIYKDNYYQFDIVDEKLHFTHFIVEPLDRVEYYGFQCDGDERYLLADGTLTHNTWILLKVAIAAAKQGLNVGIYSGEMSETKVGYRIDSLISNISNGKIIHGDISIQNEYKNYIDNVGNQIKGTIKILTPKMLDGYAGVTALRAFIEKDNLDMLCIDQHSLLEDDRGAKNPIDRAANISKDLKKLQVLKKIPIIAVSQQNRGATDNGVSTSNIAQSDRIAQDSTIVLFLEQKDSVLTLNLTKARDSSNGKSLKYAIDLNRGIFTFIPESANDTSEDEKSLELQSEFEYSSGDSPF